MARDYRSIDKYDIGEIYYNNLESKEWLGKRLSFLWDMRDHYSDDYLNNGLAQEKEEFYKFNDANVFEIANEDYHSVKPYLYNDINIKEEYRRLRELKRNDRSEFFLKKNINLYEYIINHCIPQEYEEEAWEENL